MSKSTDKMDSKYAKIIDFTHEMLILCSILITIQIIVLSRYLSYTINIYVYYIIKISKSYLMLVTFDDIIIIMSIYPIMSKTSKLIVDMHGKI